MKRSRRKSLQTAWLVLTCFLVQSFVTAQEQGTIANKRPNLLVLLSDDHQQGALGAMGNTTVKTPKLDSLARTGLVFSQAHAEIPTCQPSRASMLTGCSSFTHRAMHPSYSRAFNQELLPATWTASFKKAGYRTFWTGKWNTWGRPSDFGIDETSRVFMGGAGSHTMTFVEKGKKVTGFSSKLFADAAIRFLEVVSEDDRPFFATVAFTAPHDPRTPPASYKMMYNPSTIPAPPSFMSVHPFDDGYFSIRDEKLLPRPRKLDAVKAEITGYYGLITHMDAQIGRILDALDATGERKNTIVIYLGDHGLALGNHGLLGKMSMYSHSTQTPLIIAGPGIPKGEVRNALAYLHDLFPTTCSLAGVLVPDSVEGVDLSPVIRGERKSVRDYIYCANANLQRMVRNQRYKLMRFYRDEKRQLGSNRYAFFDLSKDPHELHDLIDDPEHQKRIADFKNRLAKWQERVGDPFREQPKRTDRN